MSSSLTQSFPLSPLLPLSPLSQLLKNIERKLPIDTIEMINSFLNIDNFYSIAKDSQYTKNYVLKYQKEYMIKKLSDKNIFKRAILANNSMLVLHILTQDSKAYINMDQIIGMDNVDIYKYCTKNYKQMSQNISSKSKSCFPHPDVACQFGSINLLKYFVDRGMRITPEQVYTCSESGKIDAYIYLQFQYIKQNPTEIYYIYNPETLSISGIVDVQAYIEEKKLLL